MKASKLLSSWTTAIERAGDVDWIRTTLRAGQTYVIDLKADVHGGNALADPAIRGIYNLPAELRPWDVVSAAALSLGLSYTITFFPARRAARMNPVDALRSE